MKEEELLVYQLNYCLKKIEEVLDWGDSINWKHSKFENLSELILKKTKIKLSYATLKRVWGKLKYDFLPNQNTLDALSKYLDYEDWNTFLASNNGQIEIFKLKTKYKDLTTIKNAATKQDEPIINHFSISTKKLLIISSILLIVLSLIVGFIIHYKNKNNQLIFNFVSKNNTHIPFSAEFNYDISKLKTDSIFIISNIPRVRTHVNKDQNKIFILHQSPGPCKVSIEVDKKIVKEFKYIISSNAWIGKIKYYGGGQSESAIFTEDEIIKNGQLQVTDSLLLKKKIDLRKQCELNYFYVKDFNLTNNSIIAETKVRISKSEFNCGLIEFSLIYDFTGIGVPVIKEGCSASAYLYIGEKLYKGTHNDLSKFTEDIFEWQLITIKALEDKVVIYINNKEIREEKLPSKLPKFYGFKYKFRGQGEVDYIKLYDYNKNIIYQNDFNK